MRRVILAIALILTTAFPAHAAPLKNCNEVNRDVKVTKGASLQCLANSEQIPFESIRGPVIVNFWGSWCAPCLEEIPYFRAFHKKYPQTALIGIDVEERSIQDGRTFVIKHKMDWPHYFDEKGSTRKITGVGVPVTLFIDAKGKIVHRKIGVLRNTKELETLAKKYLKI